MKSFLNQFPERLSDELELGDRLQVQPLQIGSDRFDEVINQGTVKWAVIENEELLIIPKYVDGQEIAHTVLTRGKPVLAVGEAEIIGNNRQYILLEINNYSGHYQPNFASLEIGKQAFRNQGIEPLS